jgi:hypothetical protein
MFNVLHLDMAPANFSTRDPVDHITSASITGKQSLHHSALPFFYYQPVSPVNIGGDNRSYDMNIRRLNGYVY